jgi:single-stranded-DNA-specific exonuclease
LKSLLSRPTAGLAQLLSIAGLNDKRRLTSEDIAFGLAPRLNAAGRLGQAQLGVELLSTDNVDRARALAEYIDQLNDNRLHLERSIHLGASRQIKELFDPQADAALVLADRGWHQGVIGIVAGRLAEKYHRPVILIALDELGSKPATGSARSVPGLDLHQALSACSEHLLKHGGHAAAAGLRIDEGQLEPFRHHFCEQVEQQLNGGAREAELTIDAEASLPQLTLRAVEEMERLAPFGQGNPRPLLCASSVQLVEGPRAMGKGDRHLSARIQQHGQTFRVLAFNRAEWIEELSACQEELDIAFRPMINEFHGRRSVELHLADWRPSLTAVN